MNIAHRGFSARYPENTLVAFGAAFDSGCTWVECDVRRTCDGTIVVLHDSTVDRTTDGSGAADEMTWADIGRLDAGSWKAPEFAGERIPSLDELLEFVGRDGEPRGQVVIELKMPSDHVAEAVDLVARHDAFGWTVASAFEWDTILAVRRLAPEWRTTWLTRLDGCSAMADIARCKVAGVTMFGPVAEATSRTLVDAAHDVDLLVRCWGVGEDRGPLLRRLVEVGADGTTTNHPDALADVLNE